MIQIKNNDHEVNNLLDNVELNNMNKEVNYVRNNIEDNVVFKVNNNKFLRNDLLI